MARNLLRLVDTVKRDLSEPVQKVLSLSNASRTDRTKARAAAIARDFRLHDVDCGSTRVQVARLTVEIEALRDHVANHPKDKHSTRGWHMKISKRKRLLDYLRRDDIDDYTATVTALGLPLPKNKSKKR